MFCCGQGTLNGLIMHHLVYPPEFYYMKRAFLAVLWLWNNFNTANCALYIHCEDFIDGKRWQLYQCCRLKLSAAIEYVCHRICFQLSERYFTTAHEPTNPHHWYTMAVLSKMKPAVQPHSRFTVYWSFHYLLWEISRDYSMKLIANLCNYTILIPSVVYVHVN